MEATYSFDQIIQDIKSDTGFSNMRNLYSQVRQLICRASYEINPYGAFLVKKRMLFHKGNGNFNGKHIKIPTDFVSLDSKQLCRDGLCGNTVLKTDSHIVLCDGNARDKVFFSYWAMNSDGNGNPMIAMNHKEAVVNFIIFKLYSAQVFNNNGSRGLRLDYKNEWEDSCMAARGFDYFPSDIVMNNMRDVSIMNSAQLSNKFCADYNTYDYCRESIDNSILNEKIYSFQLKNNEEFKLENLDRIISEISIPHSKAEFVQGVSLSFPYVGKYGFVIEESEVEGFSLIDVLGNDVISTMTKEYDYENKRIIFVSEDYISPSTVFFKIKYNG